MQLHVVKGMFMAQTRTPKYLEALKQFEQIIQKAANKRVDREGTEAKGRALLVFVQQGRKADKIMLGHIVDNKPKGKPEVLYFVDIESGNIFGVKSPVLANQNWWYGDIYTASEWNFSDLEHPVPKNPDKFTVAKVYGGHTHYLPKGVRKRLSERKGRKPSNGPKRSKGRPARLSVAK
jgi:hypothetical protein